MIVGFLIAFLAMILLGVPVAFSLAGTGVGIMVWQDIFNPVLLPHNMFAGLDSFPFLAIPFFMLAGALMEEAKITKRLMDFAYSIVGRLPGGLAHVAVLMSMIFAAMCGSAVATAAAIGGMVLPAMRERGYKNSFSAALVASGGAIGPIIPPSVPMIVYAVIAGTSVQRMFLGGIVPGVLFGLLLMGYSSFYAIKNKLPREEGKFSWRELGQSFKKAILPLGMPLIILGGIFSGFFTATEASVVAVVYSLIIGLFVFRTLKVKTLPRALLNAAKSTASVCLILATSSILSWALTSQQIPQAIANSFIAFSNNPTVILLLIMLLVLILGCFMDAMAIILLLSPVMMMVLPQIGVDPVYFGVVLTIAVCIGALTPPVGTCLFVSAKAGNASLGATSKAIVPMVLMAVLVVVICVLFPNVVMFLPDLVSGT